MNSASAPSRTGTIGAIPDRDTDRDTDRNAILSSARCLGMMGNGRDKCKRQVVWYIAGIGPFCHVCHEVYFARNWRDIEIEEVIRLSDREEEFFHNGEGSKR